MNVIDSPPAFLNIYVEVEPEALILIDLFPGRSGGRTRNDRDDWPNLGHTARDPPR